MVKIEKVGIVECKSYNQKLVDKAVNKSLELIDFHIGKNKKVLLKPNLVVEKSKHLEATITNKAIIEAICKILKKNNCKIFIGESSFTNTVDCFKKSGLNEFAKKYNAKIVIFEQSKLIKIKNEHARILHSFPVSKILKEVDLIINLPKLKTHLLTKYTGAVKNLYGVIPGGLKQRLHKKAQGGKHFSNMLLDIYEGILPQLNIMDGIVGMEGQGPIAGTPVKSKFILCSKNAIALDIACSRLIGLNPKKVYSNYYAVKRKLYPSYNFELVGMDKLPSLRFNIPKGDSSSKLKSLFIERPIVVDEAKCEKCGICASKCPQKAIKLKPYPETDRKKCIRCFCCMEICPNHALSLKK
jgi:uncharacterized protein (DUF362 family)/NAD-dependent dihydropyrimidine dehydrogenase PreA subunit